MIKKLLAATLCIFSFAATAADRVWTKVPESDQKDFEIRCFEGPKLVWGIYARTGISEYQIARDIYVNLGDDGRTLIRFKHGWTYADKSGMYVPATGASCEITEKN